MCVCCVECLCVSVCVYACVVEPINDQNTVVESKVEGLKNKQTMKNLLNYYRIITIKNEKNYQINTINL